MTINLKAMEERKVKFIKALSDALVACGTTSIDNVEYQVYEHKENGWLQEYIVVTFKGGAISVRNANANSDTANFRELGNLIDGGYYEEVKKYNEFIKDESWERIF